MVTETNGIVDTRSNVLKMLQEVHPEYHPLKELATIGLDKSTSVSDKIICHKTIVKYCEPELKSMEIKANIKTDLGVLRVVVDDAVDGDLELPTRFRD